MANGISITRATADDIDALIAVQDKAFYADFVKYGECPGYHHTRESMANLVAKCDAYVMSCDGKAVGDLLVWDRGGGAYFLGCICVIPEYQGRGVGSRGMRFLVERYPNAARWSLETPSDKEENHRFYKKHGFTATRERMDGGVRVVLFEKAADRE